MSKLLLTKNNVDSKIKDSELTVSQWDSLSTALNKLSKDEELSVEIGDEGLIIGGVKKRAL